MEYVCGPQVGKRHDKASGDGRGSTDVEEFGALRHVILTLPEAMEKAAAWVCLT